jgi:large repetitive protein
MRRAFAGAAALLVVLAAPAAAQTVVGSAFRVDTNDATSGQYGATVATDASGAFVVTWWTQAGVPAGILAQRFDASGNPAGGVFMVQEATALGFVYGPSVAKKPSGDFVVAWMQSPTTAQVWARRFMGSGAPVSGQFRVDAADPGNPARYPRVAYDTNGGFSVVWHQDPEPFAAFQRFDAAGSPKGLPVNVGDFAKFPDIAALPNGSFIVVWYQTSPQQIWGQRLDSTGSSLGGAFRVDTNGTDYTRGPRVAADPAGNFVVVWSTYSGQVAGRRFDSAGGAVGGQFRVDLQGHYGPGFDIGIAAGPAGDFVVTWGRKTGYDREIRARLLSGGEVRVTDGTTATAGTVSVGALGPGRFVVVWRNGATQQPAALLGRDLQAPLSGDADGNGTVDVADVFYLINFLFAGGPAPVL